MSQGLLKALDSEIAELEAELQGNPVYQKLVAAKKVRELYAQDHGAVGAAENVRSHVRRRVRPGMPRRKQEKSVIKSRILRHVDEFFGEKQGPYTIATIYASVNRAGLEVSGKSPKNTLSAMLSNSEDFVYTPDGWMRAAMDSDGHKKPVGQIAGASDVGASEAPKSEVTASRYSSLPGLATEGR